MFRPVHTFACLWRQTRCLSPWLALCLAFALTACSTISTKPPAAAATPTPPEAASGFTAKPGWSFERQAVAAANPLAADAGLQVLRAGGSAVDAAIAVQMVLTLVEPQSSGIGGGAFLLHWDGRRVQAYDGRETAPAAATERLFFDGNGNLMPFGRAVASGRSVGVPGTVPMLALAHQQHGRLPWARLFEPAIALAEQGFAVSPRLNALLSAETALPRDPVARAYFFQPDARPWPVGHVLRNPELAAVLRQIAERGPAALSEGPIAQAIVDKVRQHPDLPGTLSLADLRDYQARERPALCHPLRAGARWWRVCGMPPPSSGAIAIGQILGLLSRTPQAMASLRNGIPGADWLHAWTEASRLAFADRALYVADPDFVPAPGGDWQSLLTSDYLNARAALIGPTRLPQALPGRPAGTPVAMAPMPDQPESGTSHISIVDGQGHVLSMTTTIEAAFGARLMVTTDPTRPGGFLLNNELTDFSFAPSDEAGRPIANRVQPGKRPRSSMSPTLVFDANTGAPVMSAGSPGGAMIIHFTAKALWGSLHWGLHPQAALDLPNFGSLGGPLLLERDRFAPATVQALESLGHQVQQVDLTSGAQALVRRSDRWLGGADPRREGVVSGD
ncbi:MAG: gamma-glutamyltransferase family protein [Hydrogenophaga sp.]|uniref:gamma-glutamyltransferase family protein n=1 Tax=Hydrogenophaga sp. TaxID=1904254 RepID=UPI001D4BE698|nr:gamma-glutamyltransferase family protein [Hydrogenophaga sp.]MBX3609945.1 gamma-glutamyltransferase family protein [Hydrogenophaga sp.]